MAFWNKITFRKKKISVSDDIINSLDSANMEQLKEICKNKDFFLDPNFRTKLSQRCHHLLELVKPIHKEKVNNPKTVEKLTKEAIMGVSQIQIDLRTIDAMNKANSEPDVYTECINNMIKYFGILKNELKLDFI